MTLNIPDILKKIVEVKRREVEQLKTTTPLAALESLVRNKTSPLNLSGSLMGESVRVIAEVKKASPTKGLFRKDFDPCALATAYANNGAAAVSVVTNEHHFQGSIEHLQMVHDVLTPLGVPILRKEFIFDTYQVCEARVYGADAILLIVAMLDPVELKELYDLAGQYMMQCLVEIHDEDDLQIALDLGAEIIGINNRDLRTFKTDFSVTEELAQKVPKDKIVVSESGINTREHIGRLREAGAHAVLIGEALVTADAPGSKLRELV